MKNKITSEDITKIINNLNQEIENIAADIFDDQSKIPLLTARIKELTAHLRDVLIDEILSDE